MALSSERRKKLPKKDFVFPKERKEPIQSKHQAKVALTVGMRGQSAKKKAEIRKKVYAKYPGLKKSHGKD